MNPLKRREPLDDADEDAVDDDDDERDAAVGCCASPADSGFGTRTWNADRQCVRNGDMERALRRTERLQTRPRSSASACWFSCCTPAAGSGSGSPSGCSNSATASRIWPLWKSSSAEHRVGGRPREGRLSLPGVAAQEAAAKGMEQPAAAVGEKKP
jgi:hypothetical protein